MGNKGIKAKLDRSSSKFLGNGDHLQQFYNENIPGTSEEKFETLKDIVGNNE